VLQFGGRFGLRLKLSANVRLIAWLRRRLMIRVMEIRRRLLRLRLRLLLNRGMMNLRMLRRFWLLLELLLPKLSKEVCIPLLFLAMSFQSLAALLCLTRLALLLAPLPQAAPALRLEANLTLSAPLLARSACGRNVAK
jgi:hypothetical protein